MIKWSEDIQLEGWAGVVGGLPILEVTAFDSSMFGYTVREFEDNEIDTPEAWEREKEFLANHFQAWLDKAALIRKDQITSCEKCGDSGEIYNQKLCESCKKHGFFLMFCNTHHQENGGVTPCHCLSSPTSIATLKREARANETR